MGNDLTMEIIENKEIDRLQLKFSDRPAEEIRLALKKNGWNWSPKNKAC